MRSDATDNDALVWHELSDSPADIALLRRFYAGLYCGEFPDPDERESLTNMCDYLQRKAGGWYGRNNYHILLLLKQQEPVGGSICDYLAVPNAGVIEFLLIDPAARRTGLGAQLLQWTEAVLEQDAVRLGVGKGLCIAAEMHDPTQPDRHAGQLDVQTRARIWQRWGYRHLDFAYVQPALSAGQQPVRHLWLIAKCCEGDERLEARRLLRLVHDYLVWAMRIEAPEQCAEYRDMAAELAARTQVDLLPLLPTDPAEHRG